MIEKLKESGILSWLERAVGNNASDIFLSVGQPPMLKIYGNFTQIDYPLLEQEKLLKIIQALLPEQKFLQYQRGEEVDVGFGIEGLSRFRVNVFRQYNGAAVAIRPLPHKIPSFNDLRLPEVLIDITRLQHGLFLVTGPAGSGKSTTLATLINMINERDQKHIITIEDPIEYVIPSKLSLIQQREVGVDTESFTSGLRNALRESPDIIVVGELRDLDSVSLAIRAAETGMLVLGTLHSGTAVQAITRILDVFDGARQSQIRIQLAQSLQAICAQMLFKRRDLPGMVVATEVLVATLAVRNIIRANRLYELHGYIQLGMHERMHSFNESISALINQELVDFDTVPEMEGCPLVCKHKSKQLTT